MKRIGIITALMLLTAMVRAQVSNPGVRYTSSAPSGSCSQSPPVQVLNSSGAIYTCDNGTWAVQGGSASPSGAAPNMNAWYVSPNCGSQTNCTTVAGNGKYIVDATSNSTTTITCPNADCAFTSADVGKKVWATTQGSGAGTGYLLYTTTVCPVTTISTVNSATSITVGTACTASGTANVVLYWGTDDGTALATVDAAAGCRTVYLPQGLMFTSQPFMIALPACAGTTQLTASLGSPAPALLGAGGSVQGSTLVMTPDFNYAACTGPGGAPGGVCFGSTTQAITNLMVYGTGLTSASNSNCANGANKVILAASPVAGEINGVVVAGVCPGESGMEGIEMNSYDEVFREGAALSVGQTACSSNSSYTTMIGNDCQNIKANYTGVYVYPGATLNDFQSYSQDKVYVNGSTYRSHGCGITTSNASTSAITLTSGANWTSDGDTITATGTSTVGLSATSATVYSKNTSFTGVTASIEMAGSGQWFDQGGNTASGAVYAQYGAGNTKWSGYQILFGTCRGTATASQSSLAMFNLGQTVAQTCTNTTSVNSVPMSHGGHIVSMLVELGTGGVNSSSGVFTLYDTNAAGTTALSHCTTGTATACIDSGSYSYAQGDILAVIFTTQAAETLANAQVTVVAW